MSTSHFPLRSEIRNHIKLLITFQDLYYKVIGKCPNNEFDSKYWQLCVTEYVRTFTLFLTALKDKCKTRDELDDLLDTVPIPIQVYLVWHTFLLNPKSFYDNCQYNDYLMFAEIPFPWEKALVAMTNYSKSYPHLSFYRLIGPYGEPAPQDGIRTTAIPRFDNFDFESINYPTWCPNCGTYMTVPLFTRNNSGFADQFFDITPEHQQCHCSQFGINHQYLRTMKLIQDCQNSKPLPGMMRYFNSEITANSYDLATSDAKIKRFILNREGELKATYIESFVSTHKSQFTVPEILVLRDYVEANLIHCTIKKPRFEIHEDLVACALRQGRFNDKIYQASWTDQILQPKEKFTEEAFKRYIRFFQMMKTASNPLIPTMDIDLVWHTHLLNQPQYFRFSISATGIIVDHNDKMESKRFNDNFKWTGELYKHTYAEEYCSCNCEGCKPKEKSKFSLKTKSSKSKHDKNALSYLHMSYHNQVRVPLKKNAITKFPWSEEEAGLFPSTSYVNNPIQVAHKNNINHLSLYGNGDNINCIDLASGPANPVSQVQQPDLPPSYATAVTEDLRDQIITEYPFSASILSAGVHYWARGTQDMSYCHNPNKTNPPSYTPRDDGTGAGGRISAGGR